jgi:hypothetical protein
LFFQRAAANQAFQFTTEAGAVLFAQLDEAKGLEATLRSPYRKQYLGSAADAGDADMEHDDHADAFIERLLQRKQTAIDGELTQAGADLTPVFEQHQGKDRTAELYARAAGLFFEALGGICHVRDSIASDGQAGQITKGRSPLCAAGWEFQAQNYQKPKWPSSKFLKIQGA